MRRSSFNKSIDENYKSIISKQGNLNLTLVWFVIFLILTNILTILRYKKYKNENDS
jgi:hypothetical protein